MEKLKKIPIIGYLCRLFFGIAKLPRHLDKLYQQFQNQSNEIRQQNRLLQEQRARIQELQERNQSIQSQYEYINNKYNNIQSQLLSMNGYNLEQNAQIDNLIQWNSDRMEDVRKLWKTIDDLQQLNVPWEYIKKLNVLTSLQPTIWGNEDRLHISSLATLPGCVLNTNSGDIYVDAYTFCGSGVSLLAGGHDKYLTGLLRRDAQYIEGCDIKIGTGVWLASNCTVLGPATIGDYAVIAAGAVVVPGSNIPAYTIYGGVPARQIGKIDTTDFQEKERVALKSAMTRKKGVLFYSGWTEEKEEVFDQQRCIGHWQVNKQAKLLFNTDHIVLQYYTKDINQVYVQVDKCKEKCYTLMGSDGLITISADTKVEQKSIWHEANFQIERENTTFFVADDNLVKVEEQDAGD